MSYDTSQIDWTSFYLYTYGRHSPLFVERLLWRHVSQYVYNIYVSRLACAKVDKSILSTIRGLCLYTVCGIVQLFTSI
jgi:hypothetical protein